MKRLYACETAYKIDLVEDFLSVTSSSRLGKVVSLTVQNITVTCFINHGVQSIEFLCDNI